MAPSGFYINIRSIRNLAESAVYSRGEKLATSGAVQGMTLRGTVLTGRVTGSAYAPYSVTIQVQAGEPKWSLCTCPYEMGEWCKHKVALALFAASRPDLVSVEETVQELLAGLARPDLVNLITELADASPDLLPRIQYFVKNLATEAAQPVSQGSTQVDIALIKEKIKAGLATDLPPRDVIASDLTIALDLAYAGHAEEAMEILRILADGLVKKLKRSAKTAERMNDYEYDRYDSWGYDDEGIELDELIVLTELGETWAEACLALMAQDALSPKLMKAVTKDAAALEDRIQSAISGLIDEEMYIANFEEGQEALELVGIALAQGWYYSPLMPDAKCPIPDDEWYAELDFSRIRLRVLARMERFEDYLILAEEEGETVALVQMLAHLGRAEEAEAKALAVTLTPVSALELAQALYDEGIAASAMRVAERGFDTGSDYGLIMLGQWLTEVAHREGNVELAIKAAALTLLQSPDLDTFKTLRTVAADRWPDLRPDVLDRLRQQKSSETSGLCEIFLEEGLVAEAIKFVPRSSYLYIDPSLYHRLFAAAIPVDPDWVIKTAGTKATTIMDAGDSPRYAEAVDWLRYMKDAYRSTGQANIWTDYLASIRTTHGRKYKLMGLLKNLD